MTETHRPLEVYERPERQGLFDPAMERDACGVGFIADLKGASRTRSSATRFRSLRISSIAVPSAPTRFRATVPASSSRSRTTS